MGFAAPLWRAITAFRVASLAYAAYLAATTHALIASVPVAIAVLAVMAAWTAGSSYAYGRLGGSAAGRSAGLRLAAADAAVALACLAATAAAVEPGYLKLSPPLTTTWFAGAVLAVAVVAGRRWALTLALAHGVVDIAVRAGLGLEITAAVPRGVVLLLLAGYCMGHLAHSAAEAERRLAQAVAAEARTAERERLARSIHDSVLQVLAMVRRRGAEAGGAAADLGRLAGEQEERLRALIATGPNHRPAPAGLLAATAPQPAGKAAPGGGRAAGADPGEADLKVLIMAHAADRVTVSAPAGPVLLPGPAAGEAAAAVAAALDNVRAHCPPQTRTWILIEDEGSAVVVTVRDDGPGMDPERPHRAAAEGRLGLAQSVRGRLRDLGGTAAVDTAPGAGTEIEMRIPRPPGRP
ncbi:MacS family sensor histidine kinase [Nocardiopsis coralliicola]